MEMFLIQLYQYCIDQIEYIGILEEVMLLYANAFEMSVSTSQPPQLVSSIWKRMCSVVSPFACK